MLAYTLVKAVTKGYPWQGLPFGHTVFFKFFLDGRTVSNAP